MAQKLTVSVLGQPYTITFGNPTELPELEQNRASGLTCSRTKTIQIDSRYDFDFVAQTVRHELMHAFFTESGLERYSCDETLVDFIATQFPKLSRLLTVEQVGKNGSRYAVASSTKFLQTSAKKSNKRSK